MTEEEIHRLKFPIGEWDFNSSKVISTDELHEAKTIIEEFPDDLLNKVSALSKDQKKYRYRPNGWTLTQVVHHCADSHMNAFVRFKLALTEDFPEIRPYFEDKFADLEDGFSKDLMPSINLLIGLHSRWTLVINSLQNDGLEHGYVHPEHGRKITLNEAVATYAWHCKHHLAHIDLALSSRGVFNESV